MASSNPLARAIDLRAGLSAATAGGSASWCWKTRFEPHLWSRSRRWLITDVLPLPINLSEAESAHPIALTNPVRIGLVGQATVAKGTTSFLTLARAFRRTLPDAVSFHLVGHPGAGFDSGAFDVLQDQRPYERLSRPKFLKELHRLHYVCLPLQPAYYGLSASGALLDAVTWLKPILATRVPIIVDLFARFGDIGILCEDIDAMEHAIQSVVRNPDQARYNCQVANLRRIRASRMPDVLAFAYR